MSELKRYFLFHYIARTPMGTMSHGNVLVADFTFPNQLWLKEVAIPQMLRKQMNDVHYDMMMTCNFAVVSFCEFKNEEDFTNYIGGHDMNDALEALFTS